MLFSMLKSFSVAKLTVLNSKVLIGIAIVIIVIGIGAIISSSSDSNQDNGPTIIQEESSEIISTEGKQYTVELSDTVTATGP